MHGDNSPCLELSRIPLRSIQATLAADSAIRKPQGAIQFCFGDIDSKNVFHTGSSRNLPCECGLPTKSGQRYCPISRKRNGKAGTSSTPQTSPLKGGYGVRSSRSGKPEYFNCNFIIQGWADRRRPQHHASPPGVGIRNLTPTYIYLRPLADVESAFRAVRPTARIHVAFHVSVKCRTRSIHHPIDVPYLTGLM